MCEVEGRLDLARHDRGARGAAHGNSLRSSQDQDSVAWCASVSWRHRCVNEEAITECAWGAVSFESTNCLFFGGDSRKAFFSFPGVSAINYFFFFKYGTEDSACFAEQYSAVSRSTCRFVVTGVYCAGSHRKPIVMLHDA